MIVMISIQMNGISSRTVGIWDIWRGFHFGSGRMLRRHFQSMDDDHVEWSGGI